MAPKRASKGDSQGGGKRARSSSSSAGSSHMGDSETDHSKVSNGITERQLASFSEVSSEAANSSRLLQAQKNFASSSHAGFNSLLAAAGAAAQPHVLSDYNAALQLFHLQQTIGSHPVSSHSLHGFPTTFSPLPHGSALSSAKMDLAAGMGGDGIHRALTLEEATTASQLRAMLQPGAFGPSAVQALLTAQLTAQNTVQSVLPIPQYNLPCGGAVLPSMVTLDTHGKLPFNTHAFSAINAVSVDTSQEHYGAGGVVAAVTTKPDTKLESGLRSHGPSVDRYKNRWSEDEIIALKKGVTRFDKKNKNRAEESSGSDKHRGLDSNKKGESEQMWENILSSHKFQQCRTARDLKDKWRQLKKKEQDDVLGVREEARRLRMLAVGPGASSSSSGSQDNGRSGDNGSSAGSSNGHGSADQAGNSEDSPAGSSSPSAEMSSTSSPAPIAKPGERSGKKKAAAKAASRARSSSPANASAPPPRAPSALKRQGNTSNSGNGSENGSDNNSEESGAGAVGSESGGAEGGSEGSEGGGDERHGAGGSDHGEGSEGSGEGGRGQGSDGSGDTGGDSLGSTDETGQTSLAHSSHSAGTSSHEGRSDSSHEGGSEGREEGASDGSSERWEEDEHGSDDKDRKRKHASSRQQQQSSSSRSRMPRAGMMEGLDTRDAKHSWALAIDLGSSCVRVSLVNKYGSALSGVEGQRSIIMDPNTKTFHASDYITATSAAIDDALAALRKWNSSQNKCRSRAQSTSDSVCSCGKCKPPVVVRVVGISCFSMSLLGVGDDGEAATPVYTYADGRNQAHAGELKRKLAEEGSLDFVERRTAPLQSCYAPALFARLRQAGEWGNGKVKRWCSLSAYLLGKLTGKPQPMTYSEASWTGLMDREELQWHQGLLNLLGIHHTTLPALCDADDLYNGGIGADYIKRWPELTKTSWARGIGEAAAFNVGTGCDGGSRRRICVSMGTSAAIRVCIPCKDRLYPHKSSGNGHKGGAHSQDGGRKLGNGAKKSDDKDIEVPPGLCRYSVKRDLMLVGGSLADGGSIYAWGTEQLAGGLEEMAQLQAEAAAMECDSHGLTMLPFFSGGGSQGSSGGANPTTGTLTGMTLRTSRAGILRAIMESVALRLKGVFTSISSLLPDDSFEVYASGDALFKSPLWQQILVDAFGKRIHFMSGEKSAAGKGAAILALRAIGEDASVQQKPESVVTPVAAGVSAMAMAFERQEALYNRMYNVQSNRH